MRGQIRMFIPWLKLIIKRTAFRSYKSLLSVLLRLIQHCQFVVNGEERVCRERGLALSSQPVANQDGLTASVTLAVPFLQAPPQSRGYQAGPNVQFPTPQLQGSNGVVCNAQSPGNCSAPLPIPSSMPQPITLGIVTYPPPDITLTPIVPEPQVRRYDRNVPAKDEYEAFMVEKGLLDCSEELGPVAGWEPLTHPEGALFFYHPYKRVFTDADVRNSKTADKIDKAVEKAQEEARNAGISLDDFDELALELIEEEGKEIWGYYFADHRRRLIFWFEDHTSELLMNHVRGVERKSHVRYALSAQYWRHVELFPNRRSLPEDVVVELKEMIMHAQAENITSETCLAPFAPNEVASMLSLVGLLMNSANMEREHSVWIAARFMRLFCNAKFVNFCGQPGARLDVDQSLYGDSDTRSKKTFLRVMNVILFGSPDAQSKAIHRIWVDETIVQPRWKNFIDRLTTEWNGYTIFSTVMLAVDISFLAVPSVQTQTSAILLAYLSTLCALGSLLVSLILAGQVNDSRRGSAEDVVSFFFDRLTCVFLPPQASFMIGMSDSMLGLESLALMLSLPFALLIWGCVSGYVLRVSVSFLDRMVFFAAGLSVLIFGTSGIITISIASPVWAAIFMLVTWPVLAANDIHVSQLRTWIIEQVSPPSPSGVHTSYV
ncbi:hypothetical protein DFH29DRAFT_563050 [Suillus ampliporus]|nr:hypothetical protein DFH29DRAFT_563050 [Suillus ampliporus]